MDALVTEGRLYVQQQSTFGKRWRWRKLWAVLYRSSPSGVARLELRDSGAADDRLVARRPDRKLVLRLSECVSVQEAPEEPGPKEDMAVFRVATAERTLTFATPRHAGAGWVQTLRHVAFQGAGGQDSISPQPIRMVENLIYASRDEVNQFRVKVRETEAAERCSLQGAYWLRVTGDGLHLLDPDNTDTVLHWPYRLLRRYGYDKETFSMEAGRRCDSGPGSFSFESCQSSEIFVQVENIIHEQTLGALESGSVGEAEPLARRSLPTPPRSPLPPSPRRPALLEQCSPYAEPADCLRSAPVLLAPPALRRQDNQPEPLYSDVYDLVDVDLTQRTACLGLENARGGVDSCPGSSEKAEREEPEPLYSQVVKRPPPRGTRPGASDIIYDNLGEV
ncbi:docking protein 1-like isoform X2 [Arapaima gigas]